MSIFASPTQATYWFKDWYQWYSAVFRETVTNPEAALTTSDKYLGHLQMKLISPTPLCASPKRNLGGWGECGKKNVLLSLVSTKK